LGLGLEVALGLTPMIAADLRPNVAAALALGVALGFRYAGPISERARAGRILSLLAAGLALVFELPRLAGRGRGLVANPATLTDALAPALFTAAITLGSVMTRSARLAPIGVMLALLAQHRIVGWLGLETVWEAPATAFVGVVVIAFARWRLTLIEARARLGDTMMSPDIRGDHARSVTPPPLPAERAPAALVEWIGHLTLALATLLGLALIMPTLAAAPARWSLMPTLTLLVCLAIGSALATHGSLRWLQGMLGGIVLAQGLIILDRILGLDDWRKVELLALTAGLALVGFGWRRTLSEDRVEEQDDAWLALWIGAGAAVGPACIGALAGRVPGSTPSPISEFILLAGAIPLVAIGLVARRKGPTLVGGGTMGAYLVVLIAQLAWRPQLAVGVWLTLAGLAVFGLAVALSVFRDRLLLIPGRIERREGVFQFLDWR
jgi:hypothetical protein